MAPGATLVLGSTFVVVARGHELFEVRSRDSGELLGTHQGLWPLAAARDVIYASHERTLSAVTIAGARLWSFEVAGPFHEVQPCAAPAEHPVDLKELKGHAPFASEGAVPLKKIQIHGPSAKRRPLAPAEHPVDLKSRVARSRELAGGRAFPRKRATAANR